MKLRDESLVIFADEGPCEDQEGRAAFAFSVSPNEHTRQVLLYRDEIAAMLERIDTESRRDSAT